MSDDNKPVRIPNPPFLALLGWVPAAAFDAPTAAACPHFAEASCWACCAVEAGKRAKDGAK
mgnify:CR=1 FL=1